MKKWMHRAASAGVVALAAGHAAAQTDRPTFWGFVEYDAPGTGGWLFSDQTNIDEVDFLQQVHVYLGSGAADPVAHAQLAYADVHLRMVENTTPTLRPGKICVRIQNLTNGVGRRLYRHPDDAVRDGSGNIYSAAPHAAPWFSHGIAELKPWVASFAGSYAGLAAGSTDLLPTRFHLDEEPDEINGFSPVTTQAFLYAVNDPADRWRTEPVPGFTSGGQPMTLKEIYLAERVDYGLPLDPEDAVDPAYAPMATDQNRRWYLWWSHVWNQAFDAAMNASVYAPIRAAFPAAGVYGGALCSNYSLAADTDGAFFPPHRDPGGVYYRRGQPIRNGMNPSPQWSITPVGTTWFVPSWRSSADMYAPELYDYPGWFQGRGPFAPTTGAAEDTWSTSLRNHRFQLDAILTSGGPGAIGVRAKLMAPWIVLPGMHYTIDTARKFSKSDIRDQLALFRAKQVPEVNVWWTPCDFGCGGQPGCNGVCPDQPSRDAIDRAFADFRGAYRQAYGATLDDYVVEEGSVSGDDSVKLLHTSLEDPLQTVGQPGQDNCLRSRIVGRFTVDPAATPGGPFEAKVNVELASVSQNVTAKVYVLRLSGGRDQLAPYPLTDPDVPGTGQPGVMSFKMNANADYLLPNDQVWIAVEQELQSGGCSGAMSSFGTGLEALQLIPMDCPADVDDGNGTGHHDGGVDINDLLFFLAAFENGDIPHADLDDGSGNGFPDGGVDVNDMLYFYGHFEGGC